MAEGAAPGALANGQTELDIDPARFDAVVFTGDSLNGIASGADGPDMHHLWSRRRSAPGGARRTGPTLDGARGPTGRVSAPDLVRSLRRAGVRTALAWSRQGTPALLAAPGAEELFEVMVDGVDARRLGLREAPEPDLLREALARLSVTPSRAVLIASGDAEVRAGRACGFGMVVRVAPPGRARPVPVDGADVSVTGLAALGVGRPSACCEPDLDGINRWALFFEGFEPADEARREVLCATGNGYLVTRGAAPESTAGGPHYPGTYLAGVYNRLVTNVHGRVLEHEELVNAPNWLSLTFRAGGGGWFGSDEWEVVEQRQALDIRYGILSRLVRARDRAGRVVAVTQRRLVSMDDPHLAALETTLEAENWSGPVEVRSGIDGDVANSGVASYRLLAHRHLAVHHTDAPDAETVALVAEAVQSGVRVAMACRTRLVGTGTAHSHVEHGAARIDHHLTFDIERGRQVVVEKVAGIWTSRDDAISECSLAATATVARAPGFEHIAAAHRLAWERLWARYSLWVDVDGRTPVVLHLHLLHLLQSVSPHTAELDAGVTARGLHGEAYRGHVFWDELFIFPLLNFRFPELTRSLLGYRYRRLGEARRLARQAGYRGAMFPWQSGTTGREETPTQFFNDRSGRWMPDHSHRQRHVSLAIAYNVWSYYQVTGDLDFLVRFGAELMIEIARFWASAARYDPERGRYDVQGVMGPDEFHDGPPERPGAGLTNNAYTNVMASWVLWRAHQTVDLVRGRGGSRIFERLDLRPEELALWDRVGSRLVVPFDQTGRIAQFEGYEDLQELDWDAYRARYGDIGRLDLILESEGDTTNRYKLAKQADVLMLFFMLSAEELTAVLDRLGYHFDPATIPETIRYYLARTSNGSTLSRVVHAWVLARSDRQRSWQLLLDALGSDIDDAQGGTTGEGIHLGAMAGTVDLLQRCYVDLDARDDTLHVNPRLPDQLPRLHFGIDYRGHRLELDVTHRAVTVRTRPGEAPPVRVAVRRHSFLLGGGDARTVVLHRR